MERVVYGIRRALESVLVRLDELPPFAALAVVSAVTGVVMLWVVGKTTPQGAIRRARRRMSSTVYETRLFLDSPWRVFAAQARLLTASLVYVAAMMPALVVLAVPLGLLYVHLDVRFGLAPLPRNEPVVVRLDLAEGREDAGADVRAGGEHLEITAPALYAGEEGRLYLRVSIREAGIHQLALQVGEQQVVKTLVAGDLGWVAVAPERSRGLGLLWSRGSEEPLAAIGAVDQISVTHPPRHLGWLGMSIPWWIYWLVLATIVALLLRRRFGVVL